MLHLDMDTKLDNPSFILYYDRSRADDAVSLLLDLDDVGVHVCLMMV